MERVGLRFKKLVTLKQAWWPRLCGGRYGETVEEALFAVGCFFPVRCRREGCPAWAGVLQREPRVGACVLPGPSGRLASIVM